MDGRGPSGIRPRPVGQGGAIAIAKARSGARWMRMRVHPAVAQICDFLSAYLGSSVFGGLLRGHGLQHAAAVGDIDGVPFPEGTCDGAAAAHASLGERTVAKMTVACLRKSSMSRTLANFLRAPMFIISCICAQIPIEKHEMSP